MSYIRLAHLPLVAPGHPAAIREVPGRDYRDGSYLAPRYALVAPVNAVELSASANFRALDHEMRSASFAPKIAWDLGVRRAAQLHATLAGGLSREAAERCAAAAAPALARIGPLRFRLGGPFVGDRNFGRIYFPVYPQEIDGDDGFALIQDAVGAPRSYLYLVGYYNLADELTPSEAADLARPIERWRTVVIAEQQISRLVIHVTNDDLALSAREFYIVDAMTGLRSV